MLEVYEWVETCSTYTTVSYQFTSTETICTTEKVFNGIYITGSSSETTESSGGGTPGGYDPTPTQPCNCTDICPICGKCLDTSLKSAPIPGDGTTTTTTTDPCVYCSGHPAPLPDPSMMFFNEIEKINMDSPTLLQEISCLIRTLARSGHPVLIPDVIEGVGDSYVNGYEYTQKNFNYQGHNVRIVVIYDPINQTNHIGTSTEEQGSQLLSYEIYVKAKMQSTRKMPNLIRLKFEPNDRDFFISVWKHIKGETNLWNCD